VSGESDRNSSARKPWSSVDRAMRYREQADRFEALAELEDQPQARERLLELAEQYGELAGRVTRQKKRGRFGPARTGADPQD